MARAKKSRISVLNWMGTLLLCAIPGVNLIALICFWIFAKSPSKKSFAQAALLWMVVVAVLMVVALAALPDQMADLADRLREAAQPAPAVEAIDATAPVDAVDPTAALTPSPTPVPTVAPTAALTATPSA